MSVLKVDVSFLTVLFYTNEQFGLSVLKSSSSHSAMIKLTLKKNFSINLLIWIIFLIVLFRNTRLEQFCSGDKRKCIEVEGKPISCWLAGDENDRLKFRIEIKKKETLLCRTMVLPGCLFFTSSLIHK